MPARTEIRTERLLLRPFKLADANDVYAYAKDAEWGRYLWLPSPYEYADAERYVARSVLWSWDARPSFAITLEDSVIGGIDLKIDADSMTSEIGYSLSKEHWGKGFMAEAARAVIGWAFDEFEIAKVSGQADLRNQQSWRVMEKLGMKREGVLRSQMPPNADDPSKRADIVHYGILREEWERRTER